MKVKAVDIARELNISKATVSLALNNKPGVSEDTKRAVLACRERLRLKSLNGMEITRNPKTTGSLIKILIISRNLKIARDAELDLWTDVNAIFDKMAKDKGYTLGVSYIDILSNSQENMEKECNDWNGADGKGPVFCERDSQADGDFRYGYEVKGLSYGVDQ